MKISIRHSDPSSRIVLSIAVDGILTRELLPGQSATVEGSQFAIAESYIISEDDDDENQTAA